MNLAQVARLLAGFAVFFSLAQTIPLCVALVEPASKYSTVAGFGAALLIGLLIAALLWFGGRTTRKDFYRREGLAVGPRELVDAVAAAEGDPERLRIPVRMQRIE